MSKPSDNARAVHTAMRNRKFRAYVEGYASAPIIVHDPGKSIDGETALYHAGKQAFAAQLLSMYREVENWNG